MRDWWVGAGGPWVLILGSEAKDALCEWTGKVPILLEVLSKIDPKEMSGDSGLDCWSRLHAVLIKTELVRSWERIICKFFDQQVEKLKDSPNLEM